MTKPFRLAELLARVRSLLRREVDSQSVTDSSVAMDLRTRRVFFNGRELSLTIKQFELLHVLVREGGKAVTRSTLMREVWGRVSGSSKTLDTHISSLRRKLGDSGPCHIVTLRGVGYRFQHHPAREGKDVNGGGDVAG